MMELGKKQENVHKANLKLELIFDSLSASHNDNT